MLSVNMEPPIGPEFNLELHLPDATTPLVILLGPRSCGKTMLMVRLAHWLSGNGYTVVPSQFINIVPNERLIQIWNQLIDSINDGYPTQKAHECHFMSIKVINRFGEPICQILDSPGDFFFDPNYPQHLFPRYIIQLIESTNPKTWIYIVEHRWKDAKNKLNYANKIVEMQSLIYPSDKVFFICNKSDLHPALFNTGQPNVSQFFIDVKNEYPGIFSKYENKNPISRLWRKYNCDFVVFSAGTFNTAADGRLHYTPSRDSYSAGLWKIIAKDQKVKI